MIGTKHKYEISYLLVSFLQAGKIYDSAQLAEFIARNVKPSLFDVSGFSVDHLRRCMIDNGFVRREPDGSSYWVSETFLGPDEVERKAKEQMSLLSSAAQEGKADCPYCGRRFSGSVLLRHYEKKHSPKEYWSERIDQYFGRE